MDAHGLLFELDIEKDKLIGKEHTHIGVGFAWDKQQVRVVELLSTKLLSIN